MMESQNYITYLLLFVLIGIVLIIINGLYAKNNGKNNAKTNAKNNAKNNTKNNTKNNKENIVNIKNIENFYTMNPSTASLPQYFTINYYDAVTGILKPWLYNSVIDTVNLTTGNPIILSVFNDPSVYNNSLGAVGLQNNNNPLNLTYIRHANYILHSNTFIPQTITTTYNLAGDFAWVFDKQTNGNYTIYNYYGSPTNKYYLDIDNNKNVLISANPTPTNWVIIPYVYPNTIIEPTTTLEPTPMIPTVTSPLVPIIKENNDSLKKLRFSWMDNQDRLNNISTRINNVKKDLVSLMESQNTMYSASGTMTFY